MPALVRLTGGWLAAGQSGLERETGLGRTKRPRLAFPLHAPAGCPAAKFPKATLVECVSPASAKRVAESGPCYRSGTRSRQKPVDKAGPTLARTVSICISIAPRDWPARLLREFPMGWSEPFAVLQPNALARPDWIRAGPGKSVCKSGSQVRSTAGL